MAHAAAVHVPTNRVHQRWMLDHILAAIYPGEHDDWEPGVLARVDYERMKAIMIGEGLIAGAPPYKTVRRAGRTQCSVASPSRGASRCSSFSGRASCSAP